MPRKCIRSRSELRLSLTSRNPSLSSLFAGVFDTTPDDPDALPCPTCGTPTIGSNAGRVPCGRCRELGVEALELFG